MDDGHRLTIEWDAELRVLVEDMARSSDMTVSAYVLACIRSRAKEDRQYADFIQVGIDADRGELLTQEQMEGWFEARHRSIAAE